MTIRSKTLLAVAAIALGATSVVAAPVASPTPPAGRALLLVPLKLTKIDDLSFGSVIPSPVSGTVVINATTGARTIAGGITAVPSDVGRRAYFGGAGSPNQQVIVTVTPPASLTSVAGDTLTVLALTLDGPPVRSIHPVDRTFFFGVGGIILIGADQPEGVYTSNYDVTANYL
ncbi:MAG: DUF4402 domain-containing protein [Sphingomonas bacterium]|nr:DUF4402 domain-containing protein [Sphingomonas bacterium]